MSFFSQLIERRVFQIVGIYLGAMFVAFEFTDMVVERYQLTADLVDMILIGSLTMLPTIIMIAWFHGRPGRDQWHRMEKIGIPFNVLVAASLIVFSINSQQAAAGAQQANITLSEVRTLADASGQPVAELELPRTQFINRVLVTFLSPDTLPDDQRWMGYGLPYLISEGIRRDEYTQSATPFNDYAQGMIWHMKRSGNEDSLNVSNLLLKEVSERYGFDFYLTGKLAADPQGLLSATVTLHETRSNALLMEAEISADGMYELANRISTELLGALPTAELNPNIIQANIDIRDVLTSNMDALEAFVAGRVRLMLDNDTEQALSLWRQAVDMDQEFAQAYFEIAGLLSDLGQFDAASEPMKMAMALNHKFVTADRYKIQAMSYRLRGRFAKAVAVYNSWIQNEPENFDARVSYARALKWSGGNPEEVIVHFEKALELNPAADWIYFELANLHEVRDEFDKAVTLLARYFETRPNEYLALINIGDILLQQGKLSEAKDYFERGGTLDAKMVTPLKKLTEHAFRTGDLKQTVLYLDDVDFTAAAPRQQVVYHRLNAAMFEAKGKKREALNAYQTAWDMQKELEPFDVLIEQLSSLQLYLDAGERQAAQALIDQARIDFRPPMDSLVEVGVMIMHLVDGELELAEQSRQTVAETLEYIQRIDLTYKIVSMSALIQTASGDYAQAIIDFEQAFAMFDQSIHGPDRSLNSEHYFILVELQHAYLKAGDLDGVLRTGETILSTWPYHPLANLMQATALSRLDRLDEAADALTRFELIWESTATDSRVDPLVAELRTQLPDASPPPAT